MKKIVSLVALAAIISSQSLMISAKALSNPNLTNATTVAEECNDKECDKCNKNKKHLKEDVKYLSKKENQCLLSEEQKKELKNICNCLDEKKELSDDQITLILSMKETVEKAKLGEKDYKKFKELLEKEKDKKCKLTDEEKSQLKEYFKKIKS